MFNSIARDSLEEAEINIKNCQVGAAAKEQRAPGNGSASRRRREEWQEAQHQILAMAEQLKYESPHSTVAQQLEVDEVKMKTYIIQKSGRQSSPSRGASKNEEVNLRSPE